MKITFAKLGLPATGVVVVSARAGSKLSTSAVKLDKKACGALSRAIRASNFEGKKGQSLNVMALAGTNRTGVVSYGTEAGLFQQAGMATVICGPGDIAQAHKPDEFISLEQVEACTAFMRRLADYAASA